MSFPTANYNRKSNTQTNGQTNVYLTRWHPFFSFFNWISELCIRKQSLIISTFLLHLSNRTKQIQVKVISPDLELLSLLHRISVCHCGSLVSHQKWPEGQSITEIMRPVQKEHKSIKCYYRQFICINRDKCRDIAVCRQNNCVHVHSPTPSKKQPHNVPYAVYKL